MPILSIYITPSTLERLEKTSALTGWKVEELAECAVEEAALHSQPILQDKQLTLTSSKYSPKNS